MDAFMNPYHSTDNPEGKILLAVAENKLTFTEVLRPAFCAADAPAAAFGYGPMRGSPDLRAQIARLMTARICPGVDIQPDELTLNAGVAAVLSNVALALLEPGDAALIPAPYYAAFNSDLRAVARCAAVPAPCAPPGYALTPAALQGAYDAAVARGLRPACVLLTNPHNPLGRCYSAAELQCAVQFCRLRSLHLISDEIYALSAFHGRSAANREAGVEETPFTSVASVVGGALGDYIHVVWGFSKDFGGSGLRVGVLFSRNERLRRALDTLSMFSGCSGHTQAALAAVLRDDALVARYLDENARRLARSYDALAAWLARMRIPYSPCTSGIFAWIDMRALLSEATWEGEEAWFRAMCAAGVVLTPGRSQKTEAPGYFRACYAFVPLEVLQVALGKLERLIEGGAAKLK
ncbi:pyridoxal phosphate-dependent transferase [Tribonema minus]|uniref:Pyridoxal phosphate-dependent transferase n=1 Tax=Tribonema minus TaxID=303371 RepID=A0A835YIK7_9STRA|nr:pyridoxal phosphate-dependent transferase [Tribonema minus]